MHIFIENISHITTQKIGICPSFPPPCETMGDIVINSYEYKWLTINGSLEDKNQYHRLYK